MREKELSVNSCQGPFAKCLQWVPLGPWMHAPLPAHLPVFSVLDAFK